MKTTTNARKRSLPNPTAALSSLLPGGSAGPIASAFASMVIAEEEIARAKLSKSDSSRAFKALCPTSHLRGKSPDLYRAHAREIVARVKVGAKLAPGTDAECLGALMDTSLVAPLEHGAQAVAERLFRKLFPGVLGSEIARGSWEGQEDEILMDMRRKLAEER